MRNPPLAQKTSKRLVGQPLYGYPCAVCEIAEGLVTRPQDGRWLSYNNSALDKAAVAACPIPIESVIRSKFIYLAGFPGAAHWRHDLTRANVRFFSVYSYLIVYRPDSPRATCCKPGSADLFSKSAAFRFSRGTSRRV